MKRVGVLDYGVGNLLSVERAFDFFQADVHLITNEGDYSSDIDYLVLPGVGAFADGIEAIRKLSFDQLISFHIKRDRPFLGICLGMQMMLDESFEFRQTDGLGLISGQVKKLEENTHMGKRNKVPHVGWSELLFPNGVDSPLLKGLEKGCSAYFVHSYAANVKDESSVLVNIDFGPHKVTGMIGRDNYFGCQFHPEKSGKTGLKILENFLSL